MADNKNIKVFQIFYNEETRALLDPAFIPLDNSANARPDWAEYWPIRNLFSSTPFDDDDYVGVFSPRFREKTGTDGAFVLAQVSQGAADVFNFSPYFDQAALHLNSFEQGNRKHPGLLDAAGKLLAELHVPLDLTTLVCDQTTTIFANYFVARARLWKKWLALAGQIYAICEDPGNPLGTLLSQTTHHRASTSYPMKIFIMERLITILLETERITPRYCMDIMTAPRSLQGSEKVMGYLIICDALKGQYRKTGARVYLDQYLGIRAQLAKTFGLAL